MPATFWKSLWYMKQRSWALNKKRVNLSTWFTTGSCTQFRLKRPTKIFWKQFTTSVWYMNLSVAMTIPFSKSSAVSLTAMVSLILHMAKVYANITLLYIAKLISNTLYHSILHYIILILQNLIELHLISLILFFRSVFVGEKVIMNICFLWWRF